MSELFTLQEWLGALIAQPLQDNHLLPVTTPFGSESVQEAEKFIAPSPTLKPHQRIQIYHQQYWWRLIKCLQTNFPTIVRLFGNETFQSLLAVPYLSKNPPTHWALCRLGETFPQWLQTNYLEDDQYLVVTAAEIDWASEKAFFVKNAPAVDFARLSPDETLNQLFILQSHIHLFELKGDFFSFREEFLKNEIDYYNSNPFPSITYGKFYFVLYRTPSNMVKWKEISGAEHWMLSQFIEGNSIERVCARLEESQGEFLEEALSQIPFWFKQWTVLEWLRQF